MTQICRVLGKSDEAIQQTLQGCMSLESLDGVLADDTLHLKLNDKFIENETNVETHNHIVNQSDYTRRENLEKNKLNDGNLSQAKSDSESGFDESCSQMSRSGIDDRISTLEPEYLSHSTSLDKLDLEQLHLELDSVAVDWRPFRNIYTCSCAMPFDHFTKKASLVFCYFL